MSKRTVVAGALAIALVGALGLAGLAGLVAYGLGATPELLAAPPPQDAEASTESIPAEGRGLAEHIVGVIEGVAAKRHYSSGHHAFSVVVGGDEDGMLAFDDFDLEVETGPGVLVAGLVTDGAAAAAGLARGDIVLAADGQTVDDIGDLHDALDGLAPGDEVTLTVRHGDDERDVTVTLGDLEGDPFLGLVPAMAGPPLLMREMMPSTITLHGRHLPGDVTVQVTGLVPDGPAERAGLQEDEVIVSVDGQAVDEEHALDNLIAERAPGDTVTLEVRGADEDAPTRTLSVELGEHPDEPGRAFLGVYLAVDVHVAVEGMAPDGDFEYHVIPGAEIGGGVFRRRMRLGMPPWTWEHEDVSPHLEFVPPVEIHPAEELLLDDDTI